MRQATLPINAFIARNILFGLIRARAPHLLLPSISPTGLAIDPPIITVYTIRRFLRTTLNWRVRVATQASQKLPSDWEVQCDKAFFRLVYTVGNEKVHQSLLINLDQTGMIVIPGGNLRTYDEHGIHQVALLGKDEKRAFTAVLGISATGFLLGVQSIWKGKTDGSLPASHLRTCAEEEVGSTFASNERNHWSCLSSMKKLIHQEKRPPD